MKGRAGREEEIASRNPIKYAALHNNQAMSRVIPNRNEVVSYLPHGDWPSPLNGGGTMRRGHRFIF